MDVQTPHPVSSPIWQKPIPESRDRAQSRFLVGVVTPVLLLSIVAAFVAPSLPAPALALSGAFSLFFALLVRGLRAASTPAALLGAFVCMNVLAHRSASANWLESPLPALICLFLLTFTATRFGRRRKESLGLAEPRKGRRASQVIANLGMAGCLAGGTSSAWKVACIAALAEATADTLSSEMGQALGGPTFLLTSWRRVPAGTDGGISLPGTSFGLAGATLVAAIACLCGYLNPAQALLACLAGVLGLLFDSFLGATIEQRGWLGNDLVNFTSTLFSAAMAFAFACL